MNHQIKEFYIQLGKNIKAMRILLGIKQGELSKDVGLTRASIANIEGGNQCVLIHHMKLIADGLNSTIDELVPISATLDIRAMDIVMAEIEERLRSNNGKKRALYGKR